LLNSPCNPSYRWNPDVIKTLAELLDRLKAKELEAIARFGDLGHQGMIGDMYEGLTRELLTKSLFEGQGLRVVTGKVRMPDGSYSKQMDAMIVMGEAQLLPHTDQFIYPPERVIAAVEVKKTLYATALDDAYLNRPGIAGDSQS